MAGNFPFAVQNLKSIVLRKKNGNSLQIHPWNSPSSPLISFSMNENMFAPLMTGTIIVKNTGSWFEDNMLNAFDEVDVNISATTTSGDLNRNSTENTFRTYNLTFTIVNVKNTVNLALNDYQNEKEKIKTLTIEFISKSILNQEFLVSILENENFIGPIMSGDGDSFTLEGSEPTSIVMKGFNSYIKDKLGIDLDFDRTWNYCYLKRNNVSYPWGKIKGQLTILQTLQYLAENAVDYYNNQAANYAFWQDLDGYHFRSIDSLIFENKDDSFVYTTRKTEMAADNIHSLETISEFDGLNILNSKSYFSWYERVLPDYADPYLDFIDTADGLTRQNIIFNLKDEYDSFGHLNEMSIIPEGLSLDSNYSALVQSNRVDDEIYGFYSKNRYNTPFPQEWEYLGISADTRLSNVTWQNQFDLDDEVYPEVLYVYDKIIKKTLEKNREKYTRLKNAKRKWEVYRCSVCCIDQIGGTADKAIIDGMTAGSPDFVYYFGPTGIFSDISTSSDYAVVAAGAFSDVVNYDSGITFNKGLTLSYDMNSYPYNQSIGEFYGLSYSEEINNNIESALESYQRDLSELNAKITKVEYLVNNIDSWISDASDFIKNPDHWSPTKFANTCTEDNPDTEFDDESAGPGTGTDSCQQYAAVTAARRYYDSDFNIEDVCSFNGCRHVASLQALPFFNQCIDLEQSGFQYTNNLLDFSYHPYFGLLTSETNELISLPLYVNLQFESVGYIPRYFEGYWRSLFKTRNSHLLWDLSTFSDFGNRQLSRAAEFPANIYLARDFYYPENDNFNIENPPPQYLTVMDGPIARELSFQKPRFLYDCTKSKLIFGTYHYVINSVTYKILTGSSSYPLGDDGIGIGQPYVFKAEDIESLALLSDAIDNEHVWCDKCLDPIMLTAIKLEYQKVLRNFRLRSKVIEKLIEKTESLKQRNIQRYQEYLNRKAFYISKNPFDAGVTGNILNKKGPITLHNVKSIKRTPIRGSKYEILAKRKGITGGTLDSGIYFHKIFFGDDQTRDIGITGNHPYYDQKYKSFNERNDRTSAYISGISAEGFGEYFTGFVNGGNYYYVEGNSVFPAEQSTAGNVGVCATDNLFASPNAGFNTYTPNTYRNIEYFADYVGGTISVNQSGPIIDDNAIDSVNRKNVFTDENKIPSIEKEKVDSFVRIEFKNPIGLNSLADFPSGFMRDAGSEYFLPYIVQLTAGPSGRQTIQNNAVVIGMDPYGFDVAIKKNKTKIEESDYREWGNYWWHSPFNKLKLAEKTKAINSNGLWAEPYFENETTFYKNSGNNLYYIGEDYAESDELAAVTNTPDKLFQQQASFIPQLTPSSGSGIFSGQYTPLLNNFFDDNVFTIPVDRNQEDLYAPYEPIQIKKTNTLNNFNRRKYCSYNLLGSHLSKNTRRDWYDYFVSDNVYFDTSLESLGTTNLINILWDGYTENSVYWTLPDTFNTNQLKQYRNISFRSTVFVGPDLITFKGNQVLPSNENAIKLPENPTQLEAEFGESLGFVSVVDPENKLMSPFKDFPEDIFSEEIERFLSGDLLIYRPGLITSEVWKYDLFGDSEYGITKPPVNPAEYDVFGENFSAQFVVFGRGSSTGSICSRLNLKCTRPDQVVDNSECPADDPYCNCPAKNIIPKEREPSYKELAIAYEETKECNLIERFLGKDYLGCMLSDPDNAASCGCPEQGKYYPTLLNTLRSSATFYVTPPKTPLRRLAQMTLFNQQKAIMAIFPNDAIKIGSTLTIDKPLENGKYDLVSGKWMVTGISRVFKGANVATMILNLNRDSIAYGPDNTTSSGGTVSYSRLARTRNSN